MLDLHENTELKWFRGIHNVSWASSKRIYRKAAPLDLPRESREIGSNDETCEGCPTILNTPPAKGISLCHFII
jgi:hypothetical protein